MVPCASHPWCSPDSFPVFPDWLRIHCHPGFYKPNQKSCFKKNSTDKHSLGMLTYATEKKSISSYSMVFTFWSSRSANAAKNWCHHDVQNIHTWYPASSRDVRAAILRKSIWHSFSNTSCCLTQMNSQWCNKLSSYKIKRFDTCLNRSQRAGARKYNRLHCTFLSQWSVPRMPLIKMRNEQLVESETHHACF